jgi:hypothetical protein
MGTPARWIVEALAVGIPPPSPAPDGDSDPGLHLTAVKMDSAFRRVGRCAALAAVGAALALAGASAGQVSKSSAIRVSAAANRQGSPSLASDGRNYLVVWGDERTGKSSDVYGARVDRAGTVLDRRGIAISAATRGQGDPSVAFGGTNYLVVWADNRSGFGKLDVYGSRVSRAGVVLDRNAIAISTEGQEHHSPSVAFDGTNYLVVWSDNRSGVVGGGNYDLYAARVSRAGVVLDRNAIAVSTAEGDQESPSVAFDGAAYFVVWLDYRHYRIYGARVSTSGTVLDGEGIAVSPQGLGGAPSLAFDGTNYLAVWQSDASDRTPGIYAARVTPAGTVLDGGWALAISATAYEEEAPSVASRDGNFLVTWADNRAGDFDIYGARVTDAGEVLDWRGGVAISTAGQAQYWPSVAYGRANYLVAWQDLRADVGDIYGARVSQAGVVLPSRRMCRVPRVIGMTRATARTAITRAQCRVGRIRTLRSRRVGRVIRQSPKPGAVRPRGARVTLVVGRR